MSIDLSTRLAHYEALIERGLQGFADAGNALHEIRSQRLYRDHYTTFEEYCRERWGWSRIHAHRLIEAAQVVQDLLPIGNTPLPQNEAQARELARLDDPIERQAVWQEVLAEHPEGATAAQVRETVHHFHEQDVLPLDSPARTPAKRHVRAVRDFPELVSHSQSTALDYATAVYRDPRLRFSGKSVEEVAAIGKPMRAQLQSQDRAERVIGDPAHPPQSREDLLIEAFTRAQYQASTNLLSLPATEIVQSLPLDDLPLIRRWVVRMQTWLGDVEHEISEREACA